MKRIPCIAIACLILTLSGCAVKSAADAETVCDPGSGPEPPQFCLTAELPAELQRSAEDSAEGRSVYTRADGAYEVVIETAAGSPDAVLRQLTGRETAALDPVYLAWPQADQYQFAWTADPHKSWGQYVVYQVDRSVYVYDMEAQTVKELFTYNKDWKNYNYMILDGHVIAICGTGDTCRAWAIDIADESVVELDTRGGNAIAITPEYECNDYIVGLLANQTGKVEEYYISKEDFYRSNYNGIFS